MGTENIFRRLEKLEAKEEESSKSQIRHDIRIENLEDQQGRLITDIKSIKDSIADIQKLIHRTVWVLMGALIVSLMQEFGVLAILKKIFL